VRRLLLRTAHTATRTRFVAAPSRTLLPVNATRRRALHHCCAMADNAAAAAAPVAAEATPAAAAAAAPAEKQKSKGQLANEKGKAKKEAAAASAAAAAADPEAAAAAAAAKASKKAAAKEAKQDGGEEKDGEKAIPAPWVMPEYMQHRVAVWDAVAAKRAAQAPAAAEAKAISVTLPDGKVVQGQAGVTTPMDIAKGISNSLAERILLAKVNGELRDLLRPLEADCELQLLDFDTPEGAHAFWHSSAHVLGQALEKEFAESKLCIGPPVEEGGFYYDVFLGDRKVTPEDYKSLERTIAWVQKQKQPFVRLELEKEEAKDMFRDNPFKLEIINNKVPDGARCTAYRCGPLIDLCRGPHVPNTGAIKAMSVTKHSSAYWLAKAENASLQRVYGISFPNKDKMKEWKAFMKMAEDRDHRKIGQQQELFFFHKWSPGSAFFLPHGTRVYNKLMGLIKAEYNARGYQEVITPNVFNIDLWKRSGHYDNYRENMFTFEAEKVEFGMKPMNCPGHCLMFDNSLRSYRDLPIRFADFGALHRNEISGALTGLTRVRRFQQDDAHIFCRQDQIEVEVAGVLDFLKRVYGIFGFEFSLQLSTRPQKFLGDVEVWNQAEAALSKSLDQFCKDNNMQWTVNAEDGAFYGPKIDIQLTDALKRKHQCATIQLDFQLPIRFELQYKGSGDAFERPVMIHRAILGSVERFMSVLIEHTGGKWPFWLSPRQVCIVPVAEAYFPYAREVRDRLHAAGYFVDVDETSKQLAKKVREAAMAQYNYILVVGEKEQKDASVNVRLRSDPEHTFDQKVDDLMVSLKDLVDKFQ